MSLALVKTESAVESGADTPSKPGNTQELLRRVRDEAAATGLRYAGSVPPELAWQLFQQGEAVLVDVRTPEELSYVGRIPGAKHVAWATGTAQVRNPRFLRELESKVPKDSVVLLLCRSGKRSAAAAEAATKAGYVNAFNVLEGFEGDLDERQRRGELGGWRRQGLPWVQD
jgi:rhodanese-related sulfurtransferase